MDGRLTRQLVWYFSFFMFTAPSLAYNEQAPRHTAPPLTEFALQARLSNPDALTPAPEPRSPRISPISVTQLNALSFTPQHLVINNTDFFARLPSRYQLQMEFTPSGPLGEGNQRLNAYPSLQLTPQSSVGMSFKNFSPRFKIERAGLQTSLQLRGDGIKLNFRPTAISDQLQFDVKITDDESRFDLTYRY